MANEPAAISPAAFTALASLVYERAGIVLRTGKESLVAARLGKRLSQLGLTDWAAYLTYLAGPNGEDELVILLDLISTNVTSFFREPDHFVHLRQALAGRSRLRIWCAAASTGEEPYTIAMSIADGSAAQDWKILATDISTRVLDRARRGVYSEQAVATVPPDCRRWLKKNGETVEVDPRLRNNISYARLNLAQPPFPMRGPFDAIFIRNVMIYFDNPVRQRLLDEAVRLLDKTGYLYVGHTESLAGLHLPLKPVGPAMYMRT